MQSEFKYAVDVPNSNDFNDSWINVDYFETRKEAIKYVVEQMGIPKKHASLFVSKMPEM